VADQSPAGAQHVLAATAVAVAGAQQPAASVFAAGSPRAADAPLAGVQHPVVAAGAASPSKYRISPSV
jgi:hypothetical protein